MYFFLNKKVIKVDGGGVVAKFYSLGKIYIKWS